MQRFLLYRRMWILGSILSSPLSHVLLSRSLFLPIALTHSRTRTHARTHTLSHAHPRTHTHAVLVRTPTFNTTQEAATSYNILSVAAQQEKVVSWMDFFSFQLLGRIRRDWDSRGRLAAAVVNVFEGSYHDTAQVSYCDPMPWYGTRMTNWVSRCLWNESPITINT